MKHFLTLFLLTALFFTAGGAEFAKALNYRIIIPDKATSIEKAAAAELKLHLSKSFTKPVKLNGKTPKTICFFVGNSKEAASAGLTPVKYKGEFGIFRKNDNFLLAGVDTPNGFLTRLTDECGTFHSVAYFVQKYLNVKIFMPGKEGIKYASNPEIIFAKETDTPRPSFSVRGFQSLGKGCPKGESLLYFRRRLGRVPAWTRSNYYYKFLNSWNKRFKDKPEMFALHEGRRVNENYPRHFPCTSNPAVVDQVEKDVAEVLKKRPYINSIRFFSDAPVRSCSCANCRNSAAGKYVTATDHSETVYAFFCKIAKRVLKHKQGLYFHVQTKGSVYCNVPRTETLPPNTVISILTGHFLPPDYTKMLALCADWRKAGAKVIVYAYPRAPEMKDYPLMNPHRIAEYYKKFQGSAEGSNMSEGRSKVPYSFSALNTYIHSAVMFDTKVDADKLIDEFCALAAPKSSKELKKFYTAMEQLLEGAGFRDDPRYNCYAMERLQTPRAALAQALAKDPGNHFLKQLSADFANFIKVIEKTAPSVARYKKAIKEYEAAAAKRKLVKLSVNPVEFPLVPFKIYDDFQEGSVKIRQQGEDFRFTALCKENKMASLRAFCNENHTGMIWSDDAIEVFFGSTTAPFPYIHLTLNSKGIYRMQLNTAPGKVTDITNVALKTKGYTGKDEWGVEAAVPLKALKNLIKDKKFKVGFCRCRHMTGKRQTQFSGVQKSLTGSFHDDTARFTVQIF
ncbi:MAG: DUF4838 domain-containing protein [Lentisphaeria bacterium]|nr:DUF4838 domain-containing protein [Lentisphaeria bacterium]